MGTAWSTQPDGLGYYYRWLDNCPHQLNVVEIGPPQWSKHHPHAGKWFAYYGDRSVGIYETKAEAMTACEQHARNYPDAGNATN